MDPLLFYSIVEKAFDRKIEISTMRLGKNPDIARMH